MAKSIYEMLDERYGVRLRVVEDPEEVTTVGTTPLVALRQNPRRVAFVIFNLDLSNNLIIRPGGPPSSTQGILLTPSGSISMEIERDFVLPAQEWQVVGSAANTDLYIVSMEIEPGGGN